jgi:hypothetical protein
MLTVHSEWADRSLKKAVHRPINLAQIPEYSAPYPYGQRQGSILAAEFDIKLGKSEANKGPVQIDIALASALKTLLKIFPVNVGPSALPNIGSELIVSKRVPEPILPNVFAKFVVISSFSGSVGLEGAGSWIMFTSAPPSPVPTSADLLNKTVGNDFAPGRMSPGALHSLRIRSFGLPSKQLRRHPPSPCLGYML